MITEGIHVKAIAIAMLATLCACGTSPESNYYLLTPSVSESRAGEAREVPGGGILIVDEVGVAPYIDKTQMVRRLDTWRVSSDEFEVWAEPISDLITAQMVDALGARFNPDNVMPAKSARGLNARYRVGAEVLRLDVDSSNLVTLGARWIASAERSRCDPVTRRFESTRQLAVEAAVAERVSAMSELLEELADEVSAAVVDLDRRGCR